MSFHCTGVVVSVDVVSIRNVGVVCGVSVVIRDVNVVGVADVARVVTIYVIVVVLEFSHDLLCRVALSTVRHRDTTSVTSVVL